MTTNVSVISPDIDSIYVITGDYGAFNVKS